MKIKVSCLSSSLHDSTIFNEKNKNFIKSLSNSLEEDIEIVQLEDYDCDLKLIFVASGGSEGLFLKNKYLLKEPYYLLTTGENNSLAASLEILTYINNIGECGEIIHGNNSYIISRIKELTKQGECVFPRLGVIGKPSDWLIASIPSYNRIKELYHVQLFDVELGEVIREYNNLVNSNDNEEEKANYFYLALKKIVEKYHLSGLTIRCFDLLSSIKMTGCLALAKLNSEGIIATCEGDIMAMISMWLIKKWYNKSSFQANPSKIDLENGKIVLAHCTSPFNMLKDYSLTTHFESGIGIAIKGILIEEDVTIFRLSSNLRNYSVYEGKILKNLNEANLCRTQILVELDSNDLKELLTKPCGNHQIVFYGKYKMDIIQKIKENFYGEK